MRQETNNEIDLLLRRLGRHEGIPASDTDHLDADELSSYAENVLPAPARARYTEHLAECARCRELVVQLSSAAGVVVAEEASRTPAPSGFRKFLAGLFSPLVLRYAIPAMGLAVVAVIGIGLFLRGERGTDVASLQQAPSPAAREAAPYTYSVEKEDKSGTAAATPEAVRGKTTKEAEPSSQNAAGAPAGVVDSVKADPSADTTVSQPVVAAEAPPPPKPTPADEVRAQEPEARKEEAQSKARAATEEQGEKDKVSKQAKAEDKREIATMTAAGRPAKRAPASPAPAAGAGASANLQLSDAAKDRDDNEETRSVSGRRFRKLRGVWVDTAYNDGGTVNLTRGSEQYRALVADEPEIKNIADQLGGQIIVVWKGRAYRIQ